MPDAQVLPVLPASRRVSIVLAAVLLTLFLCLSFKTESLWTDEAYSAFVACHRTYSLLWQTLRAGDSSDLQMWLYYSYLHFWVALFGDRELALRAANIPFVFLYSLAIAWTRNHLFQSNWVWIAALNPFVWAYAADTRPYMCIVALSTVFVLCLVACLTNSAYSESRLIPWIALSALLIGLNLHMLMILLVPPAFVFVLAYRFTSGSPLHLKSWLRPAVILSPLFLAYFVFLAWTFGRGAHYDYASPDWLSTGAVLFRFSGLAGFAPNRHYEVSFGPYIPGMLLAALAIATAALTSLAPAIRERHDRTISLALALIVGISQAPVLSFLFKQQIEVRHIACLFALLLFLFFSVWDYAPARRTLSICFVSAVWLISDFRMTYLPEYQREDFRAAVRETLALAQSADTQIAVVADPAAAAYYGLSVVGPSPCFRLPGNCRDALKNIPWPELHPAAEATFWTSAQIGAWIQSSGKHVVLISRSRHPMYLKSAWWSALRQAKVDIPTTSHGFFVYNVVREKY